MVEGVLTKENYAMWLKILEGHYMTLFKSSDFTEALHRVLKMENFIWLSKRNDAGLPANATRGYDIDDLYKEFYVLKKEWVKEKMLRLFNAMDAKRSH